MPSGDQEALIVVAPEVQSVARIVAVLVRVSKVPGWQPSSHANASFGHAPLTSTGLAAAGESASKAGADDTSAMAAGADAGAGPSGARTPNALDPSNVTGSTPATTSVGAPVIGAYHSAACAVNRRPWLAPSQA